MTYLIITPNFPPIWSRYWSPDNGVNEGGIIIDTENNLYTKDGKEWKPIEEDHL